MLAADARALGEIALRRHDDPALALDRFDQERRSVRCDRRFERRCVAERNQREARRERTEAVAILWIGGEPDDGDRTPMKVVLAGDDLRLAFGNALHSIAPFAR